MNFSFTRYDDYWDGRFVVMYHETSDYIYIPIPKAGSSSIRDTLSVGKYPLIEKETIEKKSKFKFTFVRNPYTRLLSCWNGWVRKKDNSRLYKIEGIYKGMSFSEFVHIVKDIPNELCDQHFAPMTTILDNIELDFVGKLENMNQDWKELSNTIPIPKEVLHIENTRTNDRMKSFYNDELFEIVRKRYASDFEMFNYNTIWES